MLGKVTIVIDNKNVVHRAEKEQIKYNISDFQIPDQDLWEITTVLKNNLPIRTECKWIKGHGDSNERGELIHGPFNRKTQLNIWMDSLAAEGLRKSSEANIRDQFFLPLRSA